MQIADQESEEDRRDQAAKSVFLFVSFFSSSSFFYNYGNRALVKEIELRPPNSLSIAP